MSMQFTMIITGLDRPQIVNRLAALTHDFGGKWLVSKISRLESQVVGIIKVEVPAEHVVQLKRQLQEFDNLHVQFPETVTPKPTSHNQRLLINIESEDRLGLINDISLTLHNLGASINYIENRRMPVAGLGIVMFLAQFSIDIIDDLSPQQLIKSIQQIDENMRVKLIETNVKRELLGVS